MKKILLITLIAAVMLAGCNSGGSKQGSTKDGFDYRDNQNFAIVRQGAFSEDGFYSFDEYESLVYFIDKSSYKSTPLCSKPNCTHSDSSCNAYYDLFYGIYVNDGFLYIIAEDIKSGNMELYKLSMDGSEKSKVRSLYQTESEDAGQSAEFIIHRGVGYLVINWIDDDPEKEREQYLYRVSLEDDGMEELFSVKGYLPTIRMVNTCGDNIYFYSSVYKNPLSEGEHAEEIDYCYNAEDGSITEMAVPDNQMFEACYDDKVYSMVRDRDMGTFIDKRLEFFESDMEGGNNKSVYKLENVESRSIYRDAKYRYIEIMDGENDHLRVVDYDGREISEVDITGQRVMWSDGNNLLLWDGESGGFTLFNIETSEKTVIAGINS